MFNEIKMKNTLSYLLIFSLLIVVTAGCKKGRANFTLKGVITDASFNSNLAGATAKLYEVEAGGGSTTLIGTVSIVSGEYEFVFQRNQAESYILEVTKPNYFTLSETIYFSSLTIEEDNVRDYDVYAKSWVNLRFVNNNPQQDDQLKYIKVLGKINCEDCCPATEQYLNGAIDTNIYCINNGNSIYSYNFWLLGTSISGTRSVNTVPFDTTEILLQY